MPIVVVLLVFIGLVYGAVRAFDALAAQFGTGVAVGAAVIAAALVVAAVAYWWRRRREVAANIRDGDWTHEVKGQWGFVRLAAGKRLCDVQVAGAKGSYIFADLQGADVECAAGSWQVVLKVKSAAMEGWHLPMKSERQARQWVRIFGLAMEQRL